MFEKLDFIKLNSTPYKLAVISLNLLRLSLIYPYCSYMGSTLDVTKEEPTRDISITLVYMLIKG